jgi:hypothetical protein
MIASITSAAAALSALISSAIGATTCPALQPMHPVSVATGYTYQTVANGILGARGVIFDSAGHLLVLQRGTGVVALTLKDGGGACVTLVSSKVILANPAVSNRLHSSLAMFDGSKNIRNTDFHTAHSSTMVSPCLSTARLCTPQQLMW